MSFSVDRLDADEDGSGSGGDAAAMEVERARVNKVGEIRAPVIDDPGLFRSGKGGFNFNSLFGTFPLSVDLSRCDAAHW